MRRHAFAACLILILALCACNLGNAPGQGGSETIISGLPVVRIAAPLPNATYLEGVTVNIQAAVSNAGADIDRVEITVDDAVIATLEQPNTAGTPAFSVAQSWVSEGAGAHTIGVTAFRADGSSSAPAVVNITVVEQGASAQATPTRTSASVETTEEASDANIQARATAAPTNPPEPTEPPPPAATDTPSRPMATFIQGVNVRSGPSTKFEPPIGSFKAGDTTEILGKTPAGDWYKVRYYNSNNAWVFGQLLTVSGDVSQIPVDAGPPVPTDTPIPPTPVPVTPTPQTSANIVLGNVGITPDLPLKCGQTVEFKIDVANLGTAATSGSGTISIKDYWNGQEQASTTGGFPVIQAGQTINIGGIFLTVTTNVDQDHKLVITLNPDGAVPETTNGDNSREYTYRLAPGC